MRARAFLSRFESNLKPLQQNAEIFLIERTRRFDIVIGATMKPLCKQNLELFESAAAGVVVAMKRHETKVAAELAFCFLGACMQLARALQSRFLRSISLLFVV